MEKLKRYNEYLKTTVKKHKRKLQKYEFRKLEKENEFLDLKLKSLKLEEQNQILTAELARSINSAMASDEELKLLCEQLETVEMQNMKLSTQLDIKENLLSWEKRELVVTLAGLAIKCRTLGEKAARVEEDGRQLSCKMEGKASQIILLSANNQDLTIEWAETKVEASDELQKLRRQLEEAGKENTRLGTLVSEARLETGESGKRSEQALELADALKLERGKLEEKVMKLTKDKSDQNETLQTKIKGMEEDVNISKKLVAAIKLKEEFKAKFSEGEDQPGGKSANLVAAILEFERASRLSPSCTSPRGKRRRSSEPGVGEGGCGPPVLAE
jgi:hypothetical protein